MMGISQRYISKSHIFRRSLCIYLLSQTTYSYFEIWYPVLDNDQTNTVQVKQAICQISNGLSFNTMQTSTFLFLGLHVYFITDSWQNQSDESWHCASMYSLLGILTTQLLYLMHCYPYLLMPGCADRKSLILLLRFHSCFVWFQSINYKCVHWGHCDGANFLVTI